MCVILHVRTLHIPDVAMMVVTIWSTNCIDYSYAFLFFNKKTKAKKVYEHANNITVWIYKCSKDIHIYIPVFMLLQIGHGTFGHQIQNSLSTMSSLLLIVASTT